MRTETTTRTLYKFEELSDSAKETAREWYRKGNLDYEWWDTSFEDYAAIAEILGIDLRLRPRKSKAGTIQGYDPDISFSGFWSQGDGASFRGSYTYAKWSCAKIREYAPEDTVLHNIADNLQRTQKKNFYQLTMQIDTRGNYSHEGTMFSANFERLDEKQWTEDAEEEILEEMRSFARWIYRSLEEEWDWINSDEQVDEAITINEYEFTEDGEIA